jgi:hypothetical protein
MRNDQSHLLLMRVPSARVSAERDAQFAPADSAPSQSAGAPLCSHIFCDKPATNGDLCEPHADLMKDLREEYFDLQREFEAGW